LPPQKRNKTAKARGGSKGGPGGSPAAKKRPSTPLLVAWVLAVVFLSSLIYFARESRQLPELSSDLPVRKTESGSKSPARPPVDQAPAASSNQEKTREPATEQSEKKAESSSSRSAHSEESPGRLDLPPLAMNSPAPRPGAPSPDISPRHSRVSIVIDDFGPDLGIA